MKTAKRIPATPKRKRGNSLPELVGVLAVMVIIMGIAGGGVIAAMHKGNITSTLSDIHNYEMAIRQTLMDNTSIMKYKDDTPKALEKIISGINSQVDESWAFSPVAGASGSGGAAGSTTKRDAWGNPYGLFIYTDSQAETYNAKGGEKLSKSDSCVYFVVTSSGKNATGGAVGFDGANFNPETGVIANSQAMINNSDGVDDIGVIVRVLNGDVYSATFGQERSTLGDLKKIQWIYGKPATAAGGICYNYATASPVLGAAVKNAGSIDQYYDINALNKTTRPGIIGNWGA